MNKNKFINLITILGLAGTMLACQMTGSPVAATSPASPPDQGTKATLVGTAFQVGGPIPNTEQPAAFQLVEAAAEPVRVVQVLKEFIYLLESSSQDGMLLVVENPNPSLAILGTQCQLTGYDSSGAVTETSGFCDIAVLFPGERRTVYQYIYNHGKTPATRLEIQITKQGKPAKTSLTNSGLSIERLHYWPDKHQFTGIVTNDLDYLVKEPDLTAVYYNDQDQPIKVDVTVPTSFFISPRGEAAFTVLDNENLQPARVEILASVKTAANYKPIISGRSTVRVDRTIKFVDSKTQQGQVFFYATNPNSDRSLTRVEYQFVAYDAQRFVLEAAVGYTPLIFPGEQTLISSMTFVLPAGSSIDHIDVHMNPYIEDYQYEDYRKVGLRKNPLKVENCQYQEKDASITCILKNSWKEQISSAETIVVGFDSSGNAISISYGPAYDIPASGQIDLTFPERWTTSGYSGAPARIEAYANAEMGIP